MLGEGVRRVLPPFESMLRQSQTILAPPLGNCFSTCLACILELPVDAVPNFVGDYNDDWFLKLCAWLEPSNLTPLIIQFQEGAFPAGYSVLSSEIESSSDGHCLVALDGAPCWDPAPKPTTVIGKRFFTILCVLDPSVQINLKSLKLVQKIVDHGQLSNLANGHT